MNRKIKIIVTSLSIVVLLLLLGLVSLNSAGITGAIIADVDTASEVVNAFDKANEVSVIVVLKDPTEKIETQEEQKELIKEKQQAVLDDLRQEEEKNMFGVTEAKEFELEYQYENVNALAGTITEEGLQKLRSDPNVESIVVNKERQIFLSGSVPIINADKV